VHILQKNVYDDLKSRIIRAFQKSGQRAIKTYVSAAQVTMTFSYVSRRQLQLSGLRRFHDFQEQ